LKNEIKNEIENEPKMATVNNPIVSNKISQFLEIFGDLDLQKSWWVL
jgi:hypothetical protein